MRNVKCWICDSFGHRQDQCPKKPKDHAVNAMQDWNDDDVPDPVPEEAANAAVFWL